MVAYFLVVLLQTAAFAQEPPEQDRQTGQAAAAEGQAPTPRIHNHAHDHDPSHDHGHSHDHDHAAAGSDQNGVIWDLTLVYGLIVAASSLLGGTLPLWMNLTHTRMQSMLSFVGGLMLGIALLHMLPHSLHDVGSGSIDAVLGWTLTGVVTMFALLRAFHFHVHEPPELQTLSGAAEQPLHEHDHDHDHHHGPDCHHGHHHGAEHGHRSMSWVGVFIGLALHTLMDGVALGAAIRIDANHATGWGLFGLGTLGAVALHKPLDSLSITSLMTADGWPRGARLAVNAVYALLCLTGASLFHLGVQPMSGALGSIVPYTLAFSAGMFLSISLGDLLPEMQFHSHNRLRLTFMLLLGIAAAWGIGFLEPSHLHTHG